MIRRPLYQRLFRNAEPGDDGASPIETPAIDNSLPEPVSQEPAAPEAIEPADPFAGMRAMLDKVGSAEAEPAPGQPRDAHGRFASTAPADPNAAPAPAAPTAPTAQAPAQPPQTPAPGEMDLTPPEGISERAQARWAQLTERAKLVPELERRATETQQALDSVRDLVSRSGLAPQEFSDMLETARLVKATNPQDAQAALQRLDAIRADLAQRFGIDAAGVDPLASHADLQSKVQNMLLTREDALEIARLRAQGQQAQQITQAQREQRDFETTVKNAAASMEATLAKRAHEPTHQAKLQQIQTYLQTPGNLQRFVTTYQPHQWEAAMTLMYDSITVAAPAPTPIPPGPQPLRPSNVRSGVPVSAGPVTAESAVGGALSRLGF